VSKKKQPKKDRGTGGAVELGPDGKPLDDLQMTLAKFRATSGVLGSRPDDTNIKIDKFSLAYAGPMLIQECTLELNQECRYGLIGENGSGKTNMINAIALREVPIPEHIDMFHLHREAHPTDRSALESLVDHVKMEVVRLTKVRSFPPSDAQQRPYSIALHTEPPCDSHRRSISAAEGRTASRCRTKSWRNSDRRTCGSSR
jgi:hypothetical protein